MEFVKAKREHNINDLILYIENSRNQTIRDSVQWGIDACIQTKSGAIKSIINSIRTWQKGAPLSRDLITGSNKHHGHARIERVWKHITHRGCEAYHREFEEKLTRDEEYHEVIHQTWKQLAIQFLEEVEDGQYQGDKNER